MISVLITDPLYYSRDPYLFGKKLRQILSFHSPTYIMIRDKQCTDLEPIIYEIHRMLKDYPQIQGAINSDGALALKYHWHLHLPSHRLHEISHYKKEGLCVSGSCHSWEEAKSAYEGGADWMTYSPIFASPGKGEGIGLDKLNEIAGKIKCPIVALGGIISNDQVALVKGSLASGFASIRYFIQDGNNYEI